VRANSLYQVLKRGDNPRAADRPRHLQEYPLDKEQEQVLPGHRELLVDGLRRIFGEFDRDMLDRLLPRFEWVQLAGGEVLFKQGDTDDSLYFVISGRLRATQEGSQAHSVVLGEIARGETVGELAFFTGEPRSATVSAVRDTLLARVSSRVFREVLIAYPLASINVTRLVIERMQRSGVAKGGARPVTIGVLPVTEGVDTAAFAHRLHQELSTLGKTELVTATRLGEWLGDAAAAQTPRGDAFASARVSRKLEQVEAENSYVILVAERGASEWTRRCVQHCDQLLLVADAAHDPRPAAAESELLYTNPQGHHAATLLVLQHGRSTRVPSGTSRWLDLRPGARVFHLRPDRVGDWGRLARVAGGQAVGLVLSGGGARGFAHLGVMKALKEAGIEYDLVGGTSIGSVMAVYGAMDIPVDEAIERARKIFRTNPTGDYNIVPMVSVIAGRRLRKVIDEGISSVMGEGCAIEDLWKGFFCVSINYSAALECVLTRGPLAKSIRASVSIPGALPPVVLGGDLHIDGGTFNNFPTDVMARMGGSRIIGVNLLRENGRRYNMEEVPGSWRLLFDRARGKRSRVPGLVPLLLNSSIMYSFARQEEARRLVDLYFSPPVRGVGMLDWAKFDRIVNSGYRHAREQLEQGQWTPAPSPSPAVKAERLETPAAVPLQ
jgi:NTE family protein